VLSLAAKGIYRPSHKGIRQKLRIPASNMMGRQHSGRKKTTPVPRNKTCSPTRLVAIVVSTQKLSQLQSTTIGLV
jgi:hypothetical protein